MTNIWKRSLSLLLAVVMVVGMVPMSVFATEQEECAHVNVEYIDEPADCNWEGYYAEYCLDCETYLCEELIPANGHSWEGDVCTACGEILTAEEPAEEPADETVEEETSEEVVAEETATMFAARNSDVDGIIFLDKNRESALRKKLENLELRDMILTALGKSSSKEKVYFYTEDGVKRDVSNPFDLLAMKDDLGEKLKGNAIVPFVVGSTNVDIWCVNINNLVINISVPQVENVGEPDGSEEGEPANVEEAVQNALDNTTITVTYGEDGEEIKWWNLPEAQCVVEYDDPGKYSEENTAGYAWPGKTKRVETNAVVSIAIDDDVDGKTVVSESANVVLKDETPVRNVKFMSNGSVYRQYDVIQDESITVPKKPSRNYYTFMGWTDNAAQHPVKVNAENKLVYVVDGVETDEEVTLVEIAEKAEDKNLTYYAVWVPVKDNNGDGVADQTQSYTVKYLVDGNQYGKIFSQKYGEETKKPDTKPTKAGQTFLGWGPDDGKDTVMVAEKVTGHAVYVAKWATKTVVDYTVWQDGEVYMTFRWAVDDDGKAIEKKFESEQLVMKDGCWYDKNDTVYNFNQVVPEELIEDGCLYLYTEIAGEDKGGVAGAVDGTADDPVVNAKAQRWDEDKRVWEDHEDFDTWYKNSGTPEPSFVPEMPITDFTPPLYLMYTGEWMTLKTEGSEHDVTITKIPEVAKDFNVNEIPDSEEAVKLVLPTDTKYEISGSGMLSADHIAPEYEVAEVPNLTKPGTMTTGMGTVEITGLQEDGTFLLNKDVTGGENNVATTLVAKPATGHYVKEILVHIGGKAYPQELLEVEDEDITTRAIDLYNLNVPAARTVAQDMSFEVVFAASAIEFKDAIDAKAGQILSVEQAYNAVVANPAITNATKDFDVQYVAREAETGITVDVSGLREMIAHRYGSLGLKFMGDRLPANDKVTIALGEKIISVSEQPTGMVKTPQQVVDSFILNLQTEGLVKLGSALMDLKGALESELDEKANVRPFLYNDTGKDFRETVFVSYKDGRVEMEGKNNTKTFDVAEKRAETNIDVNEAFFKNGFLHNTFTDEYLLTGLNLENGEGTVALADEYAGRDAMTYTATAYFAGNEEYQPSQATFELKILKRTANVFVDNVVVSKHNASYDASPKVVDENEQPIDVDIISVVAGLDLNELNLDVALNGDPNAYLRNIKAKAWIGLPQNLQNDLETLGTDLSRTYDVSEIKGILEKADELLNSYGVDREELNNIIKVLQRVEDYGTYNYADAALTMDVVFSKDVYPTNPGVYINYATTADPNYSSSDNFGTILIAPAVALPNRGGVQLTLNGLAENLFIEPSDGQPKNLTVTYNGDPVEADVYYYGLHAELGVLSDTTAPTLPGVYVASTVYTAKNADGSVRKLGSDSALMVIGLTEVNLDVESKIEQYGADASYKPAVTVTDKHGNAVTDAAVTMISGSVGVNNDEDLGLDDLESFVNVSFPEAVHTAWDLFRADVNEQQWVNLPEVNVALENAKMSPETLDRFLNWCNEKLTGDYTDELKAGLRRVKFPERLIDNAERYFTATMNELLAASDELVEASGKLMEKNLPKMEITFKKWNDISFHDKGVYFFYGIVTDPDYTPASNAGVMIIKAPDAAMVLMDTYTPYDGTPKEPFGWDKTGRDGITFVIDRKANTVNFMLDGHMEAVVEAFETETGKTLDGLNVSELYKKYEDGTTDADKLIAKICEKIKDKAIEKFNKTAENKIDKLTDLMEFQLNGIQESLHEQMQNLNVNATIHIPENENDALPVNVGTYEFYSYSYAIEVAYAKLVIEPIYVRVTAPTLVHEYDGQGPDINPAVSYYSFDYVEGQKRENHVKSIENLPAGINFAQLNIQWNTNCSAEDKDWVVGEYPITITNAKVNNVNNVAKTVDVVNGNLTITPRMVEVKAVGAEKFFGDKDPAFMWEIVKGSEVNPGDLQLEAKRADTDETVGMHDLTVVELMHNPNYTVNLSSNGQLNIKQAEIKITIGSIEKRFDESDEIYGYTYTYEIVKDENGTPMGFGDADKWTDAEIRKYIEETLKLEIKRATSVEDKPGEEIELIADYVKNDKNVKVVEVVSGKVVNTLGDYICWNTETETYYDDVTDALKAAVSGQTVQMLKDATAATNAKNEEVIVVYNGLTFDLNGFYVETENLLSYGVVMDSLSGTDSVIEDADLVSGGIMIDVDTTKAWTQLQSENGDYIPVYDTVTGSYKFFRELPADSVDRADGYVIDSYAIGKKSDSNMVQFGIRLLFENREAYKILNRTTNSGLKVVMDIKWTSVEAFHIEYTLTDGLVASHSGNQYNDDDLNKLMILTIRGLQNVGSGYISAIPSVETQAAVTVQAEIDDEAQVWLIP